MRSTNQLFSIIIFITEALKAEALREQRLLCEHSITKQIAIIAILVKTASKKSQIFQNLSKKIREIIFKSHDKSTD